MIKRKMLYALHRKREASLSHHSKSSANIISRLTHELDKHPLPYRIDYSFPYHLIVYCNGVISVFAGGFNNRIDVLKLKQSGEPYHSKYERSFLTPKGATNYILRKWGKPRN